MSGTNMLGIHALVWTGEWNTQQAELAVRQTAEAGYALIELPMLDPGAIDVQRVGKAIASAGLSVTCSLGLPFDADISSSNADVRERGEAFLRAGLEASSDVGAALLTGVLYSALGKYTNAPTKAGWKSAAEALTRLADRAQELGVTLGLEIVNRYESNLINTAADALRMIDDIGRPNVVAHLDTYHMNIEEGDFSGPVVRCGDRLGYVHVGESHRGHLGSGVVDFSSLFRTLAYVGYSGPITFESFSSSQAIGELAGTLAVWRGTWDEPFPVAVAARQYLESLLAATAGLRGQGSLKVASAGR